MAQGYSYIVSSKLWLVFNVTSDAHLTDVFLKTGTTYYFISFKIAFLC